ncbi:hypothetical protein [Stutzerimonas nitrititolerans]|uniref:hypothetical protein n=1 Tax=Stutzerimonas nitrititolerans TaxID=2482751 RepID=UPI00289A343E|nr:hypothetical protein [Stutzerimonas nitrititolerans]
MSLYTAHCVADHYAFIFSQLFPLIIGYTRASNTPSEVVVLVCFPSLTKVLQAKILCHDTLPQCIDGARQPTIHEAPEGLH